MIAFLLQHGQANQGLDAGQEDAAGGCGYLSSSVADSALAKSGLPILSPPCGLGAGFSFCPACRGGDGRAGGLSIGEGFC